MRNYKEIIDDPLASAEEIDSLPEGDRLRHPNCPPGLWWGQAMFFPLVAIQSPLYPLLTLESPERWEDMERTWGEDWLREAFADLPRAIRFELVIETLARALTLFDDADDARPRLAYEALLSWIAGSGSEKAWARARSKSYEAYKENSGRNPKRAAVAEACCRSETHFYEALVECARAHACACEDQQVNKNVLGFVWDRGYFEEQHRQWLKLLSLKGIGGSHEIP